MVDYFFSVVNKMNESHVRGRGIFHSTDLAEVLAGKTDLDLADMLVTRSLVERVSLTWHNTR
jgi:hypothetical protein